VIRSRRIGRHPCSRLPSSLALVSASGRILNQHHRFCEITYILALDGRDEEIGQAGAVLPPTCRWREAILLTAGKQYSKAAAVYDELGSAPLAADARLLAAGQSAVERRIDQSRQQLDAVVAFADKAGATLYRQHAERLRH
jgi:hypothetical protein